MFSYGLAGDLVARHSLYPARLFTMPVSTAALVGWPMLYGAVSMAGLWVVVTLLALRPSGFHAPLLWPALFAAAFLAWLQAITWMPYGLPGLRMVAAVLLLTTIDAVVLAAIELEARGAVMVFILAPQIPLAYLAAHYAVSRARRGDTPDWSGLFARLSRLSGRLAPRRDSFASAAQAQRWFEWRQHGRSLPAWVALVLPFEVLFLYLVRHEPPALTVIAIVLMLLTPPFLAAFVAVTVGRSSPETGSAYGLLPFVTTRPLATPALVTAKLRTALTCTLCAWALVAAAIPLALSVAGSWPLVADKARALAGLLGAPRAAVLALLALAALLATTWKQIVQGLAVGLFGREWLVKASVLARLSSLVALGLVLHALRVSDDARVALWNALPWIARALVAAKMCAAALFAARLARSGVLGDRTLVTVAAGWLGLVLALYGVLAWMLATPHLPHDVFLLVAVLAVPLVRPAAVALAVASNRHQGAAPTAGGRSKVRRPAFRAALGLFAVPLALAAALALSFHVRNRHNGRLVSSGETREYALHVPKNYDRTRPTPLVISMHGGALWGAAQRDISRWDRVADEHGFLVVYPSGVGGRGPRAWRAESEQRGEKDVRFIADLIAALSASHNIDPKRIYADGLSNGGGMAFLLSCAMPDRIAAVGLVASAQFLPWSACRDQRAVPMIAFHGTEDGFTPYHGGSSFVAKNHVFPSIPTFVSAFSRRNRCQAAPVESAVASDVSRRAYIGCAEDADVTLYTVHGGGHTWPGGGPQPEWFVGRTSTAIDASREMWAFFRAHPLGGDRSTRHGLGSSGR